MDKSFDSYNWSSFAEDIRSQKSPVSIKEMALVSKNYTKTTTGPDNLWLMFKRLRKKSLTQILSDGDGGVDMSQLFF